MLSACYVGVAEYHTSSAPVIRETLDPDPTISRSLRVRAICMLRDSWNTTSKWPHLRKSVKGVAISPWKWSLGCISRTRAPAFRWNFALHGSILAIGLAYFSNHNLICPLECSSMTTSQQLLGWFKYNALAREKRILLLVCTRREMQTRTSAPSKTCIPSNFDLDDEIPALLSTTSATCDCSARRV